MNQRKFGHFLTGALIGVGLGILIAPKEGTKAQAELKDSFLKLLDTIKNVDLEETKVLLLNKLSDLKDEIAKIDKEQAMEIIKEKTEIIEEKCDEIIKESQENSVPFVEKAAKEVKEKATIFLNEMIVENEKEEEEKEILKDPPQKEKKKKKKRMKKTSK